jgi:uncharacterized protein
MMRRVLLDTGPLVAFLNRRDQYHSWSVDQWSRITPPLLTCEAALAEACFLVQQLPGGSHAVVDLVHRGVLTVPFRLAEETVAVSKLLDRYADVPMSLADACLVRMAEQHAESMVLTLDSDFKLYRKNRRQVIPTLMPENI